MSAVALWPGGPLRPRAASLRSFVPADAQLVLRLDPATCLDSPFVLATVGSTGTRDLAAWALGLAGLDTTITTDDALTALALVSELVVFVRDDETYVVARMTPLAHALSIVDRVWSPPADMAIARYRDVLVMAPRAGLTTIADDADADAEEQPASERPFDRVIAWSESPGTSIRFWARPSRLGAMVTDRDAADLLGMAAVWLTPSRLETVSAILQLAGDPTAITLRIDVRPDANDSAGQPAGGSNDQGALAARLRARHLAAADATLWHAGLAGSIDQVARALLRDRVFVPRALEQLAARLHAATLSGVAVALTQTPRRARDDTIGAAPARFVAAVRLRPGIDDRRVAAEVAERLGAALRRDVAQELTAGGRTIIRVTGPEGPALVIGRGELILFETRAHGEPLIATETWSEAAGATGLVADARIDFTMIEAHVRARVLRAEAQQLLEERESLQEDAKRAARLDAGVIQIATTPDGHTFDITISPRAIDNGEADADGMR